MKTPKYKYLISISNTLPDRSGNVYTYFIIADSVSGRSIRGIDVPESNICSVPFYLNGGEHKENYWLTTTILSRKQFDYYTKNVHYIGCGAEEIAQAFRKAMKTRKKVTV
jgi:hypothetical protein